MFGLDVGLTAGLCAAIGALGPSVVRRLPEPPPVPRPPVDAKASHSASGVEQACDQGMADQGMADQEMADRMGTDPGEPTDPVAWPRADAEELDGPRSVLSEPKPLYATLGHSPKTELILAGFAGLLGAIAATEVDERALLPVFVVFCGVGAWLAWVDWRTRLLPFRITSALHLTLLVLVGLAAAITRDWTILLDALLGNLAIFALFWLIWFIGTRAGSTFGYGDVRLAGIIGLTLGPLGWAPTLAGVYAGFILGAVFGIVLSWLRIVDRKAFAFGPYLIVGAVAGLGLAQFL